MTNMAKIVNKNGIFRVDTGANSNAVTLDLGRLLAHDLNVMHGGGVEQLQFVFAGQQISSDDEEGEDIDVSYTCISDCGFCDCCGYDRVSCDYNDSSGCEATCAWL